MLLSALSVKSRQEVQMQNIARSSAIHFRLPSNNGDDSKDNTTGPIKDPEAPDTVIYCTLPDAQGIYDVSVLEPDGFAQTVFSRMCIGITEVYDGGKFYGVRTRLFSEIKSSNVTGNNGIPQGPVYDYPSGTFSYQMFNGGPIPSVYNIYFLAEFFLASDPKTSFARVPLGHYYRDCRYSPPIIRIDLQGYMIFANAPSFANLIAPSGLLWTYTFHPLSRCP